MPPKSPKQDGIRRNRALLNMVKGIPGCQKLTATTRDIELVEAMMLKGQSHNDMVLMRTVHQLITHDHTLSSMDPDKRARLLRGLCAYFEVTL